ncbi:MAG: radical SAM protein [Synergistaceae bacterium]|nr:radical SAM protein [Synergistaceae bacterium]
MRLSKYDTILPLINSDGVESGEHALVNGLYGAVDMISPEEHEIIAKAVNDPSLLSSLTPSRIELLTERGHLTENEALENEDLRMISRINTMVQSRNGVGLILLPTYNCNFRCVYCYERHRLERGKEWLERVMSRELVDAVFAQIKNYKERGFSVKSCTLFGGEPLLAQNKELIRYICDKCRELDMSVGAITNGYDLDKFIDILEEYKFDTLQITVDGTEEVHNRMRPLAGGGKSYAKIMQNIKLALDHDLRISMRVNVNKTNISGIRTLINLLKASGLTEYKNFSYYFKAAFDYLHVTEEDFVSDKEIVNELIRTGSDYAEAVNLDSAYIGSAGNFAQWLDKKSWPYMRTTYCGSENGMNVIGPDGLIYSCWNVIARDDKAVGIVDEEEGKFLYDFSMSKWRTRTVDRMTPCKTCSILMLCGGGCAAPKTDNLSEGFCEEAKEAFAELAPRILWKVRHEGLESISKFNGRSSDEPDKTDSGDISKEIKIHSKYSDNPDCLSLSMREFLSGFTAEERKILLTSNDEREVFDMLKAHQ